MATLTTTQHQRAPLWAALAVASALLVGGAASYAIDQANDQPVQAQAPTTHSGTTHANPWTRPNPPGYDPNSHVQSQPKDPSQPNVLSQHKGFRGQMGQ